MKRLAWFSPIPFSPPGTPDHHGQLITSLRDQYLIDIFSPATGGKLEISNVSSPYDFVWKHAKEPYDLISYDLADSPRFYFCWAHLIRYPGLVILHDESLHQSRTQMLLSRRFNNAYRDEFHYNHPKANKDIAELGFPGAWLPWRRQTPISTSFLFAQWPMRRIVLESSRLVVVNNHWLGTTLASELSEDRIEVIRPGAPAIECDRRTRNAIRDQYHIGQNEVLFAIFGSLTRTRRVDRILRTLAQFNHQSPSLRLILCGDSDDAYNWRADADQLGLADTVIQAQHLNPSEVSALHAAADVCMCLQWPSGSNAVASWVEALAAGTPSIVTDLADNVDVPSLDPRDWQLRVAVGPQRTNNPHAEAACVAIDIFDEDHSLQLAVWRLAYDESLRSRLSTGAKLLWEEQYGFHRAVKQYVDVIEKALESTFPSRIPNLPHLCNDATGHMKSLLEPFGVNPPGFEDLAPFGDLK